MTLALSRYCSTYMNKNNDQSFSIGYIQDERLCTYSEGSLTMKLFFFLIDTIGDCLAVSFITWSSFTLPTSHFSHPTLL